MGAVEWKSGHRRASQVPRWWLWTASRRSTKPYSWNVSSVCRRPWLASRRKLSSWRITSSNWWRRSVIRPSEWCGPMKGSREREISVFDPRITELRWIFVFDPRCIEPNELKTNYTLECFSNWTVVVQRQRRSIASGHLITSKESADVRGCLKMRNMSSAAV